MPSMGTEKSKGTKVFALAGACATPAWSRCPSARRWARSSTTSAAASRRQALQGRADRRPVGRLHPAPAPERAAGLRVAAGTGRHHGLGRPDRDGRGHLHGGRGPLLPRVRAGGIVRQVRALPRRHQAHAGDPQRICEGKGEMGDIERLEELGADQGDLAVRAGPDGAEPGAVDHPPLPRRVRGAHPRQALPAGVCPALVPRALPERLPGRRGRARLRLAGGEKRYAEALRLHRERNPFAAVCARVCFHTCEDKCRRATLDEPVSIRGVKRFMVDQE
jgi:hypothetical protein